MLCSDTILKYKKFCILCILNCLNNVKKGKKYMCAKLRNFYAYQKVKKKLKN